MNADYYLYLQSSEWKAKRQAVWERESGLCQGCRAEPIEHVHHSTYSHLFDEPLFQLVGLCENCHRKVHFVNFSFNPWKP
jgi:5-methylcytosine-specific restriction endonuclease McrA